MGSSQNSSSYVGVVFGLREKFFLYCIKEENPKTKMCSYHILNYDFFLQTLIEKHEFNPNWKVILTDMPQYEDYNDAIKVIREEYEKNPTNNFI